MKANGEPIVMVTAYDYPSALAVEEAGRRHGPRRRLGGDDRARPRLDGAGRHGRDADALRRRPPRPEDAVPRRRHALRLLRELERAGDRERAALHQGGRLRRGQARARRCIGRPRQGDRPRRHPGDGPRRPDPADGDRARRLQGSGPDRRDARRRSPRTRSRCRRSAASRSSSRPSRPRSRTRSWPR